MNIEYDRDRDVLKYQEFVHSAAEFEEAALKLGRVLVHVFQLAAERMCDMITSDLGVPHYITYELQHPRKKPRGSIRRARRNR